MSLIDAVALADETSISLCLVHRDRSASRTLQVELAEDLPPAGSLSLRLLLGDPAGDFWSGPVTRIETRELPVPADGRSLRLELPPACVAILHIRR